MPYVRSLDINRLGIFQIEKGCFRSYGLCKTLQYILKWRCELMTHTGGWQRLLWCAWAAWRVMTDSAIAAAHISFLSYVYIFEQQLYYWNKLIKFWVYFYAIMCMGSEHMFRNWIAKYMHTFERMWVLTGSCGQTYNIQWYIYILYICI